jgi:hypothetical protein
MNQAGGDDAMPRRNVGRFRERPDERELDPTPARRERIPADRAPECVTPTRVEPAPWCQAFSNSSGEARAWRM